MAKDTSRKDLQKLLGKGQDEPNKKVMNHPVVTQIFSKGADSDTDRDIAGATQNAKYYDALNARPTNYEDGSVGSMSKIRGETVLHDYVDPNQNNFYCLGGARVNGKVVSLWADITGTDPPIIAVDADVVAETTDLFDAAADVDFDVNENVHGGEIMITDNVNPPIVLNIQDMVTNAPAGVPGLKYSTAFVREKYDINQRITANIPVFDGLVDAGAGGGLPTGQYSYAMRYASRNGDRTNWTVSTPMAFVPDNYAFGQDNAYYPFVGTYGNDPDPEKPRRYGIRLKFRVHNIYNYDYIEIKRTAYNSGEGIGFLPESTIVKQVSVAPGEISIRRYIDSINNQSTNIAVSEEDEQSVTSAFQTAKTVRYFHDKLALGNVQYQSRVPAVTFILDGGDAAFYPIVKDLGTAGYNNVFNHVNYRGYMHGERYGFTLVLWDENFQRSFTVDITGREDFQLPNRRVRLDDPAYGGADSVAGSDNPTRAASTRGVVEDTFDCVDYLGCISKPLTTSNLIRAQINVLNDPDNTNSGMDQNGDETGYLPWRPATAKDKQNRYDLPPNPVVHEDDSNEEVYSPNGFAPRYNALGVELGGLTAWPTWAKAFSVFRSPRAGKVIMQGMSFYKLAESAAINNTSDKSKTVFIAHFPDIDFGTINPSIVDDMIANPSDYSVQFVAPYGFFSELYHGKDTGKLSEFISYARVQAEQNTKRINPGDTAADIGIADGSDGFVRYGKWRNPDTVANHPFSTGGVAGDVTIPLTDFNLVAGEEEEGVVHYELEIGSDLYNDDVMANTAGSNHFSNAEAKKLHEPIYVINIVKTGVTVSDREFSEYIYTGSYVKFESTIGYSTATLNETFNTVDERVVDFHTTIDAEDRYVWVDELGDGNFVRYINLNGKSVPSLALIAADIVVPGGTTYNGEALYGAYTSLDGTEPTAVPSFGGPEPSIIFSDATGLPPDGAEIQVRYNNEEPVKVFGGDTFVGESLFPLVHRRGPSGGGGGSAANPDKQGTQFLAGGTPGSRGYPVPYHKWDMYPSIYQMDRLGSVANELEGGNDDLEALYIKQWVMMYTCQTFAHLPLAHGEYFPRIHYVMRPYKWSRDKPMSDNKGMISGSFNLMMDANQHQHLYPGYEKDFPDEIERWHYGGFRMEMLANLDYAKVIEHEKAYKGRTIDFVEQTWFPNRVAWSQTRPLFTSDVPNLRSFRPFNIFDISDKFGPIKKLWDSRSRFMGDNLYAFCEDDVCVVMTRKQTVNLGNGKQLGVLGSDDTTFVQDQQWLGHTKKGAIQANCEDGFSEAGNSAFFPNRKSVYFFMDNDLKDIGRTGYMKILYPVLTQLKTDTYLEEALAPRDRIASVYNDKNNEYWLQIAIAPTFVLIFKPGDGDLDLDTSTSRVIIDSPTVDPLTWYNVLTSAGQTFWVINKGTSNFDLNFNNANGTSTPDVTIEAGRITEIAVDGSTTPPTATITEVYDLLPNSEYTSNLFVFSDEENIKSWIGQFAFSFDKYLSFDGQVFGFRNRMVYELDKTGYQINGADAVFELVHSVTPELGRSVELIRARVVSDVVPTLMEFYEDDATPDDGAAVFSNMAIAEFKDYHGFENYVGRDGLAVGDNRLQGTTAVYRITHDGDLGFTLKSLLIQWKLIR